MSDPYSNAASLWPSVPSQEQPEPQRWVRSAMEPTERQERLRELAVWVDWLRTTFELHNNLPPCWYRHSPVVEHLTALYVGWIRTYAGDQAPGRELAEADWINTLYAVLPRLQLAACAAGRHEDPPPMPVASPGVAEEFEVYLQASRATTGPAWHPAEAELSRRRAEAAAPL
ncbi:hypothetical protein ACFQ6U_33115 [Streptomyces sp. NPDC056465]|uniref:hypothetical protein n=1 Tax=Streptomyces sp. NPDC056465 TaxID=3345829 RepID=UPI00367C51D3